jgi:histidine triad (HIT) family protein
MMDARVFALVPTHHYGGTRGNCLVIPRIHYENVLDIPDGLGNDFFRATRRLADAMMGAFGCEGISTRQHNGPAGDQDVWHYHLHVIPRYPGDGLHAGRKVRYAVEERIELAARLRAALR